MADVERVLLWKAIQTGEFNEVVSRGIEADHFADPECRELYEFCQDFTRLHAEPPPTVVVKEEFPDFKGPLHKAPLSYHMERFVLKAKERTAIELVRDYADAIEDPEQLAEIEIVAFDMARRLSEMIPAPRVHRFSEGEKRLKEYEERKKTGNIRGIMMGIPTFDEVWLGIQPAQLVTIVAYMGVGKSLLMAYFAYSAYLQGKTTLMISLEMDAAEIMERIDVMASNVKMQALKALELDVGERKKWEKVLERAEQDKQERDIMIRDDISNCTSDHVFAEVSKWKPDLVCVDYLELMKVPRSSSGGYSQGWEKVSAAGEGLKQNARILKVPHVTAAQINREGGRSKVDLGNVSHQSIGKHSDIMLGLAQDEEQEMRNEMDVIALKARGGKKPRTTLRWNLDRMDIGEKGIAERFPQRQPASQTMIGKQRRRRKQLEIAREVDMSEKPNPWKKKAA